jgi:coronin-7
LFQDDLFPPTRVTWSPTITAEEWFDNKNKLPAKISLQPEGMDTLSSIAVPAPIASNNDNNSTIFSAKNPISQMSPEHLKAKEVELKKSVSDRVKVNFELEQDTMEGVDAEEWNE